MLPFFRRKLAKFGSFLLAFGSLWKFSMLLLDAIGRWQTLKDILGYFQFLTSDIFSLVIGIAGLLLLATAYYEEKNKNPVGFVPRIKIRTSPWAFLALISLALFVIMFAIRALHHPTNPPEAAKMEWGSIRNIVGPANGNPFFMNIYQVNSGNLDAIDAVKDYAWRVTETELDEMEEENGIELVKTNLKFRGKKAAGGRIPAGDRGSFDSFSDQYLTEKEFQQIRAGAKKIYLMGIIKYRDSNIPADKARYSEFCAYFSGDFSMYHRCKTDHNKTYIADN